LQLKPLISHSLALGLVCDFFLVVFVFVCLSQDKHALCDAALGQLRRAMHSRGIDGFPDMICAPSTYQGYRTLVTTKGLGSLRPNTVMLGWHASTAGVGYDNPILEDEYCALLRCVALAKKTLLICKGGAGFPASNPGAVSQHQQAHFRAHFQLPRVLLFCHPHRGVRRQPPSLPGLRRANGLGASQGSIIPFTFLVRQFLLVCCWVDKSTPGCCKGHFIVCGLC
jgi:hypothetical protein